MLARFRALVMLVAVGLVAGCGQAPGPETAPLVITTVLPLYEFTSAVAGDRAEVTRLVPPGVKPAAWEPTTVDRLRLERASAFVYNGAGLEPWVDRLLAKGIGAATVVVDASEGLAEAPLDGDPRDGYVWLDPVNAQAQVEAIRAGLARADEANAATYAENAARLVGELDALHQAFAQGLGRCARREIVVSRAAYGHLAARYELTQVALTGLPAEVEPDPDDTARVADFLREHEARYVFFDTLAEAQLAGPLVREAGAEPLVLHPVLALSAEEAIAGATYVTLMRQNLKNLRVALDCS
jgi:zinc transport system substrate-binding protein